MKSKIFFAMALYFSLCSNSFAQLPLVTDNTGTQGKGKAQIEISNGAGFNNAHRCVEHSTEVTPVITAGMNDKTDIVLSCPFIFSTVSGDTAETSFSGFSDICIEVKYCFWKKEKVSFAVKPGISFPTGNYKNGLGSGKFSESLFLISTFDFSKIVSNLNAGYLRNENRCGDAPDIWHISADIDYSASKNLHIVVNSGAEKCPDLLSKTPPVFALIGLYYFLNEDCELSIGYKKGITVTETNHAFIYGLTLRF